MSDHRLLSRRCHLVGATLALAVLSIAVLAADAAASELSWSAPQKIDSTESPYPYPSLRVSCATASFCVAVDANDNAMIYNGSSWTAPASVKGSVSIRLSAVSCPTASFCMVGGGGEYLTYNGSSWSAPTNNAFPFNSVSCPSTSFCVGVGGRYNPIAMSEVGEAITYNGSSWSAPAEIDGSSGLDSVSCPSALFCVAADYEGRVVTYNGSSWSTPADIDGTEGIGGVSCVSTSFCVAVDWGGNALTYNGSSWSAPSNIDGNVLSSVSCPSSSFCAAVGDSGDALTYNGSSWTKATAVYGLSEGAFVSCTSSSFCVATEAHGNAMIYAEHESSTGAGGGGGGGSVGGTSGGGSGGGGGGSGGGGGESGAINILGGGTLLVRHNALAVDLECVGPGKCSGKATLSIVLAGAGRSRLSLPAGQGSRKGTVTIGKHPFSITAGKSAAVKIHLNAAGKKSLAAGDGKLKAHLAISGTASGKSVRESKAVTLKQARK